MITYKLNKQNKLIILNINQPPEILRTINGGPKCATRWADLCSYVQEEEDNQRPCHAEQSGPLNGYAQWA